MEITVKQQHMLNRVCELTRELLEARPQDAPLYDDAKLVEYAFEEAVLKMREELILSDPDKVREREEKGENAEKACDAHEKEAKTRRAEFYNFGWCSGYFDESDWFTITSKTTRGKFSTSRHVQTGKVQHCWHN